MEDEYTLLFNCIMLRLPGKKNVLFNNLKNRLNKMSANEIFLFVINPPNEKPVTQKLIAKDVFECFKIRNKKREGRQKVDQMCVCVCNYHYICNKYT